MSSTKPAIVIVPGAWHVPAHYRLLQDCLESGGYEVTACSLPSCGPPEPLPDMSQDIAVIQDAIKSYIVRGLDVVVVMHSLGGLTGSSACQGLRAEDQASGKGVVAVVYLASFCLAAGLSVMTSRREPKHAPWITLTGTPGSGIFMQPGTATYNPIDVFYNDCSPELQQVALRDLEMNHSEIVSHCVVPYAAWKEIESNYLICELDNAFPVRAQELLSSQEGGRWKRVERLRSGHSPFLSKPAETAAFVRRCAGEEIP